ncbi:major facilitator superfamily domain-containing protein [Fusarium redolens]|uniref:Major facilitator superfamily domain-containing protein n=1 Tax=Fusarium redolens TaxID=48865 RepID=A0A9P9R8I9_FUSRE|nr:major facilitator superfamily domain-containing protein [Fusarium redolens]KAH7269020.1 major facilitator superfamily domain-containing protein [Fusarium redolens]
MDTKDHKDDGIIDDTYAEGTGEETVLEVDHIAERQLCRKFDVRLMPVLAIMYLFNALDKGNLGNAQTVGLSDDLNFKPNQYNLLVSIFFVPYVIFAPPTAIIGKKYGPARVLPILMFTFGSMTLLAACTQNFGGMFALRFFLGMAESGFFPLVIYYLTTFYRRGELARRLAIFYAASNIANAFSGLLSFGVFQIDSKIFVWRYLFIIEGSASVLFSIFAFWYLPRSAAQAKFLGEEEKALAFHRMQVDSSSVVQEKFNFKDSIKIFTYPTTYCFLLIEICLGVPIQSVALFMPQIIQRLGYGPVKTNLYTVAPNVGGAVMLLILAFSSDFLRIRFPFIMLGFALTFIGFIIYAAISDVQAQLQLAYYACFMMVWGTSAPSVLLSTWYNNNIAHEGRRVVLTSVGVPLANLMGLVSSNIFRENEKPKYPTALITTACFGACGCLIAGLLGGYMVLDNMRRNRRAGRKTTAADVPTKRLRDGPAVPEFRWFFVDSLDTPSMIVDLDVMEANIKKLMDRLLPTGRSIRPHLKTSKSAIVAKKLAAAGAKGGCVAKLSEAEAIAAAGFTDLLITCEIVGPAKVKRLVELFRKHNEIRIVVDDERAATAINDALEKSGIEEAISVLIDLDVGLHRTGTQPEGAIPLAKHISTLKHMRLIGVQGYEGHLQHLPDFADRKEQCLESMKILTDTAQALKNEGFNIEVVTTGGTGTADFCATVPGVTELQPGSFIFMDTDYRKAIGSYYSHSLSFLATVVSKQGERQVTIDTGLKSLTTDSGLAECKDQRYSYFQLGDEHGALTWEEGTPALDVGDRVEMIPSHIDPTVNLHDFYYAYRNGVIEEIWPVDSRGKVQ